MHYSERERACVTMGVVGQVFHVLCNCETWKHNAVAQKLSINRCETTASYRHVGYHNGTKTNKWLTLLVRDWQRDSVSGRMRGNVAR